MPLAGAETGGATMPPAGAATMPPAGAATMPPASADTERVNFDTNTDLMTQSWNYRDTSSKYFDDSD